MENDNRDVPDRDGIRPGIGAAVFCTAVMAVAGSCALLGNPPVLHVFPVRQYELPSGLRVAIEQEDSTGMVGIAWAVDAGRLDDPPTTPGLSHLVEHLVLRAPDESGAPLDRRLTALGADGTNGITSLDRTRFFTFVPRPSLDTALALLATRFSDPLRTADDALVAHEHEVTGEEMRMRRGIASTMGVRTALAALAPPGHPFAGLADLDGEVRAPVNVAEARRFAALHYRPDRMTLVICGAVSPADDQRLLAALPASLRGHEPERHPPIRRPLAAPAAARPRPAVMPTRVANVRAPELWMSWLLPPVRGLATIPFEVLGGVVAGVLAKMVNDGELPDVLGTDCVAETSALGGGLVCRLVLRPTADPAATERRAARDVDALFLLYDQRFVTKERNTAVWTVRGTSLASALSVEGVGRRLMIRTNLAHEDPNATLSGVLEAIESIVPEDVSAMARSYLREDLARSVLLVPDPAATLRGSPTPVLMARSTGAAATSDAADDGEDESGDAEVEPSGNLLEVARAPGAGAALTTRLANGLTIIALRRSALPFVSMVLGFHAEPQPGDPPGVAEAAIYGRFHPFIARPVQRGLLQKITRTRDRYDEAISTFSSWLPHGFELLDDEAQSLSVKWPAPAFDRWLEMATLASGSPAERADSSFARTLWRGHPYAGRVTREQLRRVTGDQIRGWLNGVRRPDNGALVIVGDIDPAAVARMAADDLGSWKGAAAPLPPPPPIPVVPPRAELPVLFTSDPARETVDLHFGCFLPPAHSARDEIAGATFREIVHDDLLRKLRYKLGVSYDVRLGVSTLRGGTHVLDGHVDAKAGAFEPALAALRGWLEPTGPLPDEAALTRARWHLARKSALGASTNYGVARSLLAAWSDGLPLASLDDFPKDLAGLTSADVNAVLAACRATGVVSVVGPELPAPPAP
jgi:zinc protease